MGALGRIPFPAGYYIYTGSAKRGLNHRLARHLRRRKKHHWHVDYLTAATEIVNIVVDDSGSHTECQRHELILNLPEAQELIPHFGSSDCRCRSHLVYFKKKPEFRIEKAISIVS